MADQQKITIKLTVDNIGPHYGDNKIAFLDNVDSNKAIFFATNGTGKSFISRTFRLAAPEKLNMQADDLLTLGQTSGNMVFSIVNGVMSKEFRIAIEKGKAPTIQSNSELIFHVFNSDFVEENIKPNNYTPDGNIEGYILGKVQIDLTEEKEKERKQKEKIVKINKDIDKAVDDAKKELKSIGIESNTTEFKMLNRQELETKKEFGDLPSFHEIVKQLEKLSNVPENLKDVVSPAFTLDDAFLNEIDTILSTEYPKSEWDEEFVAAYKANRSFIEMGLDLTEEEKCPFCNQLFDSQALTLINRYRTYRADKEAQVLAQIDALSKKMTKAIQSLKDAASQIKVTALDVDKIKEYFPSVENVALLNLHITQETMQPFDNLLKTLNAKCNDLAMVCADAQGNIKRCREVKKSVELIFGNNSSMIAMVNRTKNNANLERLSLRRSLCKVKFLDCQNALGPLFYAYKTENTILKKLQESILVKEQQAKVSKRDKVFETVTYFLNLFFAGKYTMDKTSFQIKFLGSSIGERASRVLSDGEKSIVAYCYYLATTHLLVAREDEYNDIFFIIDDPISSMDFHYVYIVAQSLRNIKNIFGITKHERVWVFTHNMEFLSIIARNRILTKVYAIKPGKITTIDHRLLLPYESHLKDIVEISKGTQEPSHTTPNSIRHILETICKFEYPERGIESYISENEILSNNACIFTLCQDMSHGDIRNQAPFTADVLKVACQKIVDFMKTKYQGQIEAIK